MLSQLWPLIEQISVNDRRVFEPACGHAAFLTATMRWLREWSGLDEGPKRHRYVRQRLRGIEYDPFAVEIAKLSLTLADVPYGNTWQIDRGDMFAPGVLRGAADWATVILSNPPYEGFKKSRAKRYLRTDEPVTAQTKAVEMLKRTVPNLAPGAVFGFVLPQGTLYDREAKDIRRFLLESCEVVEISLFEDDLFNQSDHETCIVLGRRTSDKRAVSSVTYRRVRNRDMEAFTSALDFTQEDRLDPTELGRGTEVSLYEPDLREVWQYMRKYRPLDDSVDVQQGFQFKTEDWLRSNGFLFFAPRAGVIPVALRARQDYDVWSAPLAGWLKFGPKTYRARGGGAEPGHPQVILNYARAARDPWRLKPVVDDEGIAVSSRFLAFRPVESRLSLTMLWAILLSPLANAYSYCWTSKRETLGRLWLQMPLPDPSGGQREEIEAAASAYLALAKPPEGFALWSPDEQAIERALLRLDAAVLRLYDLPTDLENQLLRLFDGVERLGVGCRFRGYPEGWTSKQIEPDSVLPQDDRPIWERIESLAASLPDEAFEGVPTDGGSQHDHYLYGSPNTTAQSKLKKCADRVR